MTGPTVQEYVDLVSAIVTPGTLRTYGPYWKKIVEGFELQDGSRVHAYGAASLRHVKPTRIAAGSALAAKYALRRRGHRSGSSAGEHYVAAWRVLYTYAIRDGVLKENPALRVPKPKRQESRRHALNAMELSELWVAAAETGKDPALDVLLLRFHQETGARMEGALNLTRSDLHTARQTVTLHEKGTRDREQPVSGTLLRALLNHYEGRAQEQKADAPVFRFSDGRPLTRRRYNALFERLRKHLPWADEAGVSAHWLRHTAITSV